MQNTTAFETETYGRIGLKDIVGVLVWGCMLPWLVPVPVHKWKDACSSVDIEMRRSPYVDV